MKLSFKPCDNCGYDPNSLNFLGMKPTQVKPYVYMQICVFLIGCCAGLFLYHYFP